MGNSTKLQLFVRKIYGCTIATLVLVTGVGKGLGQTARPWFEKGLHIGVASAQGEYTYTHMNTTTLRTFSNIGVGVGADLLGNIIQFEGGSIFASGQPTVVFGTNPSFDIISVHVPIGAGVRMGNGLYGPNELSAAFSTGYMWSVVFGEQYSALPYASIDITAGVFNRGAFQLRYLFTLGKSAEHIQHQWLMLVIHTGW